MSQTHSAFEARHALGLESVVSEALSAAVWGFDELLALASQGPRPQSLSVYGDQAYLLLDLDSAVARVGAIELEPWLRELVCPVIGLRDPALGYCRDSAVSDLAAACDVVVDEAAAIPPLLKAIENNPVAACSFVRLLRATESMPLYAALDVESAVFSSLQGGHEYQRWLQAYEPRQCPEETGPAVLVDQQEDTLELTLNRPENRNAMSVEMRDALVEALSQVAQDAKLRRLVIRAKGPHFSTGGDLSEFGQVPDSARGHLIRLLSVPGRFLADIAERVEVELHGHCVGSGIEFPAFAGTVRARPGTCFSLPEVGMGLIPGAGGCISIARRIGRQRLAWLGLSGHVIEAPLALEWGLVDEIIEEH